MTEKRTGAFPLSTSEEIFAALLGGATPLIPYYIISGGIEPGYMLCFLPIYIGIFIFGALGGWIGAGIATRMLPRFRKLEVPKELVIVLGAVVGGILGVIIPFGFFLLLIGGWENF